VLVLLTGEIYELPRSDGPRWHDIYTSFHDNLLKYSNNIEAIFSTVLETAVLVLLLGVI
jgi:hypothetical protein